LIVALNRFVALDYTMVIEAWNTKAKWLAQQLQGIPGVKANYALNTMGYGDVDLSWDRKVIPLDEEQVKEGLMLGEPPLAYDGTTVRVRCLREGEEMLAARRLRQFFIAAALR
jgi:hypothetical protein